MKTWITPEPVVGRRPLVLQPHQKSLKNPLKYPHYIYWGMGSGKTLGGIVCMQHLQDDMKALVICDKSTVEQWCAELRRVFGCNTRDFNKISACVQHFEYMDDPAGAEPRHFDMVIVDEAHRFRNAWEKQSARMLSWMARIKQCPRIIYMSGTPIVHDAKIELDAFFEMMDRTDLGGRVNYYDPRTDEKRVCFYATVRDQLVKCPMTWAQCFHYLLNRRQTFTLELGDEPRTRLSSSRNTYNSLLRSICNLPFPNIPNSSSKMETILQKLQDNEEMKQVVYSSRRDTGVTGLLNIWITRAKYPKSICRIDGSMSSNERSEHITRFNRCSHGVLFITDAGGQGIDLKRVHVMHIMEPAENVQEERQIINRAVRYKAHKDREAVVQVFRYISVFPEHGRVEAPWKQVLKESGMFARDEMKGITRKVQYALMRIIKHEEHGKTIDERVIETRDARETEINAALARIREYVV